MAGVKVDPHPRACKLVAVHAFASVGAVPVLPRRSDHHLEPSPALSAPWWQVWVDTGGTFTDCIGVAPDGAVRRAKVLSSSRLRGTVVEVLDNRSVRVDARWSGHPGLVEGLEIRFEPSGGDASRIPRRPGESRDPSVPHSSARRVHRFDPERGTLTVDDALPPLRPGDAFEIEYPDEAPILAARMITGVPTAAPLPPMRMRLATTRGTNALLTRRGARIVLFLTGGFADLLTIGTQQRPDLFALRIRRPEPLTTHVVELPERLTAQGDVLIPLDEDQARETAAALLADGFDTAAVALLHAYRNPQHERRLGEILRAAGFRNVSLSSALSPTIGLLDRARTTVTNAYLAPTLDDYLNDVARALGAEAGSRLMIMTSAGGLVPRAAYNPRDSLLSGPAGGVVGAAAAGRRAGFDRVISFDMGGTSTDVARVDRDFDYVWRHRVGDAEVLAPALAIESVAAGGGSICDYGPGGLTVGPDSAGASPGPACYGGGGPLTITDCNLLLGRLDPDSFGIPVSVDAAEKALQALTKRIEGAGEPRPDRLRLLEGLIDLANEKMADAIRGISLQKGYDPTEYALIVFGGAGAQHGCGVAARLGMGTIVVPADPGLLSARGLGAARLTRVAERQLLIPLDDAPAMLSSVIEELEAEAIGMVAAAEEGPIDVEKGRSATFVEHQAAVEGIPGGEGDTPDVAASRRADRYEDPERISAEAVTIARRVVELRLAGQNTTLSIDLVAEQELREAFAAAYQTMYGHRPPARQVEIESVRVIAQGASADPDPIPEAGTQSVRADSATDSELPRLDTADPPPSRPAQRTAWIAGEATVLPLFDRGDLADGTGEAIAGPALVIDPYSTILVEPGWTVEGSPCGALILRLVERNRGHADVHLPEVVRQQLFTARFEAIVEQMGEQLRRTSLSTNVKERLDFSCALLSPAGELIANAPHIPVHLGALGVCVRAISATLDLGPGDVVITNHPGFGGSHLPDVTLVTPVHDSAGRLIGYVANRAHHAEIGGSRPGSMPPAAVALVEEGVVIPPTLLIERGNPRWDEIENLLGSAPFPSRAVEENLADLRGQLAANRLGGDLLFDLAEREGFAGVVDQMDRLAARSERLAIAALAHFGDRELRAVELLDDGTPLEATLRFAHGRVSIDFTGSGPVHPGNLNATPAIVRSAVLYVLRLLIDEPIPLNEGLLRPVTLILPNSLLNPRFGDDPARDPAVVGGNTEVSQRLVDTLIRALGILACGQGTMNNVLWGTSRFGYYETIGGGSGAGPGFAGADGVHIHMTNTRITDSEVIEHRYPVRVWRFGLRPGSGGSGAFRGGDGIQREIEFLEPMSLSLLSQHRVERPYGMAGGNPGSPGRQWLVRPDGRRVDLKGIDAVEVERGDRLVIETPGGGGWGEPVDG